MSKRGTIFTEQERVTGQKQICGETDDKSTRSADSYGAPRALHSTSLVGLGGHFVQDPQNRAGRVGQIPYWPGVWFHPHPRFGAG